jgi:hypothetical protein
MEATLWENTPPKIAARVEAGRLTSMSAASRLLRSINVILVNRLFLDTLFHLLQDELGLTILILRTTGTFGIQARQTPARRPRTSGFEPERPTRSKLPSDTIPHFQETLMINTSQGRCRLAHSNLPWKPMKRTYGLSMAWGLLKVSMSSPDTGDASTPTGDAVHRVSSHSSRRPDKLLGRHTGRPGKRGEEKILVVPEGRRKMLPAVSF